MSPDLTLGIGATGGECMHRGLDGGWGGDPLCEGLGGWGLGNPAVCTSPTID